MATEEQKETTPVPEQECGKSSTDVDDSTENKTTLQETEEADTNMTLETENSKKRQRDNSDVDSVTEREGEEWSSNPNKIVESDSCKKQRVIDRQLCENMDTRPPTRGSDKAEPNAPEKEDKETESQPSEQAAAVSKINGAEAETTKEPDDNTTTSSEKVDKCENPQTDESSNADKAPPMANDTDNVASKSIFSGLFRQDIQGSAFNNPFQKQAAEGEGGFLSNRPAPPTEAEEETQEEENMPPADVNTGEEEEDVKFEETRVILKKFFAKEPGEKPKWQGGSVGRLKLLQPKKEARARRSRVLMRNVGTLDLLINSPVELAKSLTKQDTTSHKYCAIFSAINQGSDDVIPHCVVFDARERRDLFISTFDEIRNQFCA